MLVHYFLFGLKLQKNDYAFWSLLLADLLGQRKEFRGQIEILTN